MSQSRSLETDESSEKPRKFLKVYHTDDDSGVSGNEAETQSTSGDNPTVSQNAPVHDQEMADPQVENSIQSNPTTEEIERKSESLAYFIIKQVCDPSSDNGDEIESTLLRCVNNMMTKHEILFKGMMRRLSLNDETAYIAFLTVANELFEGDRKVVNWGKIVALYAFGGQLALYCKEKGLFECGANVPTYVARYAKETIAPFVEREGGWKKICEEFPADDEMDQKVWKFLTWTAVGLGLATAASFFTSR